MIRKFVLVITISLVGVVAVGTNPVSTSVAFAQKRDKEQKKKDPPGPPVVKDKGKSEKPKEPPPKKKPS